MILLSSPPNAWKEMCSAATMVYHELEEIENQPERTRTGS